MDSFNIKDFQDVGIDLLKTSRIKLNDAFIKKILSTKELEEFNSKTTKQAKIQYLATVWSTKEAIFKLNISNLNTYSKISILHTKEGKPYCDENPDIMISISHEKEYTIAVAFLKK